MYTYNTPYADVNLMLKKIVNLCTPIHELFKICKPHHQYATIPHYSHQRGGGRGAPGRLRVTRPVTPAPGEERDVGMLFPNNRTFNIQKDVLTYALCPVSRSCEHFSDGFDLHLLPSFFDAVGVGGEEGEERRVDRVSRGQRHLAHAPSIYQ